jgi:hypothetical protein
MPPQDNKTQEKNDAQEDLNGQTGNQNRLTPDKAAKHLQARGLADPSQEQALVTLNTLIVEMDVLKQELAEAKQANERRDPRGEGDLQTGSESLDETNCYIKKLLQLMLEKGGQAQELYVATPSFLYGFFSKPASSKCQIDKDIKNNQFRPMHTKY